MVKDVGEALLQDIRDNPADDTPRLVYADWLDEQGEGRRAEFIRDGVELAALKDCRHGTFYGNCRRCFLKRSLKAAMGKYAVAWSGGLYSMLVEPGDRFLAGGSLVGNPRSHWHFDRGFVWKVGCPLAKWLEHGAEIVRRHPVTSVKATDRKPHAYAGTLRTVYGWVGGVYAPGVADSPRHMLPVGVLTALDRSGELYSDHSHGYCGWGTEAKACDVLSDALIRLAKGDPR